MELTCIKAKEIENAGEDVHAKGRFSEVVPREKGAGVLRRVESSPESLEGVLVSKSWLRLVRQSSPGSQLLA